MRQGTASLPAPLSSTLTAGSFFSNARMFLVFCSQERSGCSAGHREGSESFLQCVAREVREEINYFVPPERFEHMESFRGADSEIEGGTIRG